MQVIYKQERDRWLKGDRYIRAPLRRLLRGEPTQLSGMQRVVRNFCKGLEKKGINYNLNGHSLYFQRPSKIISFGLGRDGLDGVHKKSALIAAVGFPHPKELPNLPLDYNLKRFLQHSPWILDFVKSSRIYPNEVFATWPAGIDAVEWAPASQWHNKGLEILIYDKIHWNYQQQSKQILDPIKSYLRSRDISFAEIRYGKYTVDEYKRALNSTKAMIFLCEHETQGFAYQEALSMGVPVLAWDQGQYLDPDAPRDGNEPIAATSVPFFDERCGLRFENYADFLTKFETFFSNVQLGSYQPRDYILENLTIEKSTDMMLSIYNSI